MARPWGLLAWENPDTDVTASPFWNIPTLKCTLAGNEPPLAELLAKAGAAAAGLRLGDGVLILEVERGAAAVQLRLTDAAAFPPDGGVELRHGLLDLPQTMRRERDLWNLVGGPAPRPGRVRGRISGTSESAGRTPGRQVLPRDRGRAMGVGPGRRGVAFRRRAACPRPPPDRQCKGAHEGRLPQAAARRVTRQ